MLLTVNITKRANFNRFDDAYIKKIRRNRIEDKEKN